MISLLYVDDEQALLNLFRRFLEQEGDISVITVTQQAGEALALLASGKFDAIISDYQMPDIDGIAFLRTVRLQLPEMPFILFTGRGAKKSSSRQLTAVRIPMSRKEAIHAPSSRSFSPDQADRAAEKSRK